MTSDREHLPVDPPRERRPSAGPAGRSKRPRGIQLTVGPQLFIKKGLARFDPHDPYYFAISLGWRRFGLLFLAAELAINAAFAALYMLQPGSIANLGQAGYLGAFFFSLETLATVGYGEMYPATLYAHTVSSIEILTGVVFMAIMTGLLFIRFSRPKAKIQYASHAVVTPHNGRPTLMLRIGNARSTLLHNACFTLHVLLRTTSSEGVQHAAVTDLRLMRPQVPVLAILHTVMHVLEEDSPLHEIASDRERFADLRFFLALSAHDPATGQDVSDVFTFNGSDIRFGMRYADAVRSVGNKVVADYALLSELVPASPAADEAFAVENGPADEGSAAGSD